jgi:hypothetical protein
VAAGVIALVSFVVRLQYPARSQQVLDLHVWQWPQLFGMFALGALVSRHGWAREVPARLARWCWIAVAATLVAAPLLVLLGGITDFAKSQAPFVGGWQWQAVALDLVEATLVVAGSVGLLRLAQRRLTSQGRLSRAAGRSAYLAFMLQVPVLLTLEIGARFLPVPITLKAFGVGALAIVISFWLGWLLVTRTRLGRLL